MDKLFIKNRQGQRVAVIIDYPNGQQKGLAFVMHGLSGFKEQPHIQTFADAFLKQNYVVVRFDTTNTFGESDGQYEDATTTNYYNDLEDVITWARGQSWYQEPFVLAGHSLGGICTALFAEKYPEKVKALAPISTVVSGTLSAQVSKQKKKFETWRQTGWLEKPSISKPGTIKRLKWSHMEDRLKYDLLPEVRKLTMPVLFIVGEDDDLTPPEHQKLLYEKLPGQKEMYIIKGAPHTFREPEHLQEIAKIFSQWLEKV
ncbi:MAG: OsmC-like protein family protein [Candidatus Uhrbacteria bacterium GW2011_GWA2_53_10]|uniref:OsmC-like protein family protein n=1 Tax=Candidatus Uhrbacteria bacterium GW2011_GWA2_53_10 TaxID=1618980 RepID=A0A0G1ZUY4_9BACT|nr:MAG: OsmC-like protein family protein [Candidatus Uhrbacteria bacterium GW2011_GWA2_53_10]